MNIVKVAVTAAHPKVMDMLQRRISGILKGIAELRVCHINSVSRCNAQLFIVYAFGSRFKRLQEMLKGRDRKVYGVEMTLLPAAVKTLCMLPPHSRIGVIAEHQSCANFFLSEIIRAGVIENKFIPGTFEEMPDLDVDYFIYSEEMDDMLKTLEGMVDMKKVIPVPRTVSAKSASELINIVLEMAKQE